MKDSSNKIYKKSDSWRGFKIGLTGMILLFLIAILPHEVPFIFVLIPWLMAAIGGIMHMLSFSKQMDEKPDI